MPPAVPFADPGEILSTFEPPEVVDDIHPGAVALGQDRARPPGRRVAQEDLERVLGSVQVLEDHLGRARGPLHARYVIVAGVAGDIEPDRLAAVRAHHADPRGRVGRARFGVLYGNDEGIQRVGVVDEVEVAYARGVELPESDATPVRAPAEPVAQVELLLVHPIEGAVDDGARAVAGEAGDAA